MVEGVNPAVEKVLALQEQEARKLSLESQLRLIPQEVAKAQADGSIKVHGALPRLPLMLRLTKLLSVVG